MSYRIISSRQTEAGWVTTPLCFVAGTILLVGVLHFGWLADYYQTLIPDGISPVTENLVWGAWLLMGVLSLWWSYRFKRVALDDEAIYVSDFLQRAKLPLREILSVRENRWIKAHTITIEFAGATPWGHHVKFMPKIRLLVPRLISHPVVADIRERVSWAKLNERVAVQLQHDPSAMPPESES
jgi:hypothetical protein